LFYVNQNNNDMESLQIENLITLVDAGFVAAVIAIIETLKGIFPKIATSKPFKACYNRCNNFNRYAFGCNGE
jgi:hypothetical protein